MIQNGRLSLHVSDPLVWLNCTAVVKKKLGDDRLAQITCANYRIRFYFDQTGYLPNICHINISKTIHKTYFLKLFHFGKITKPTFILLRYAFVSASLSCQRGHVITVITK